MKRNRVLSFMSAFGKPSLEHREQRPAEQAQAPRSNNVIQEGSRSSAGPRESPTPRQRSNTVGRERSNSRPTSMVGGYIPPVMDIAPDTIPELFPIFTLLNSHSNKLYQEGYFLKLNDLDVHGKPYSDRSWTECFAQLVGTVLSLWDAAALDAAGEEGEVAPSFINLADASIKMMNTLQTGSSGQNLQNVLSISTAGKNRYLLHFSSFHVLSQWTAAIRLAMFENTCLQEAYTGSLIAGKGKTLNAIKQIMTKTVFHTEEWTRVRFGAGTPWRRCWCVVSPPDPKVVKQQTKAAKKSSAYSRSAPVIKGDIKFYDTHKVTKKTKPVATISDAYSTYAVYPQSRALIDQSTLIKIEGTITIHSSPEITTEGFVFVMPEVHPAVSGFEMMLRFLFPIYDVFHLYGRPTKLIADTLDTRGLMFALPQEKRYGYLELFDMTSLINMDGSSRWTEAEWRKKMKNLVSEHVSKARENNAAASRSGSRHRGRNSLPGRGSLRFADSESMRSDPSLVMGKEIGFAPPDRTDSAPPGDGMVFSQPRHNRSVSENMSPPSSRHQGAGGQYMPSRLSQDHGRDSVDEEEEEHAPPPPSHGGYTAYNPQYGMAQHDSYGEDGHQNRSSSEGEAYPEMLPQQHQLPSMPVQHPAVGGPEAPVGPPPAFMHQAGSRPGTAPRAAPELRRANSRMSSTTLSQLAAASNPNAAHYGQDMGQGMGGEMGDRPGMAADPYARQAAPSNPYTFDDRMPRTRGLRNSTSASPSSSTSTLEASSHAEALQTDLHAERRPSPLGQPPAFLQPSSPTRHASHSAPNLPLSPTIPTVAVPELLPNEASSPIDATANRRTNSIARKPIPKQPTAGLSSTPSAVNKSIRRKAVESAMSRIQPLNDTASDTEISSVGGYSSNYSDSVKSPNSSSRAPITLPTGQQIPDRSHQVRTGVLRVAGGTDADREVVVGDAKYKHEGDPTAINIDLPSIDFGPTQLYAPEAPGQPDPRPRSQLASLSQENLLNFTASHMNDTQSQPLNADNRPGTAPDLVNDNGNNNRRSMAWQPSGSPRPESRQDMGLTPEEFVQQRSSPGRVTPVFAHGRQQSMTPPRDGRKRLSKTPPGRMQHTPSGEWSAQYAQAQTSSRPNSRGASATLAGNQDPSQRLTAKEQEHDGRKRLSKTPPGRMQRTPSGDWSSQYPQAQTSNRPNSRGASATLVGNQDLSQRLTAREQEHVARVTNTPLINLAGQQQSKRESSGGLVSAIAAREQEKQAMKAGYGGQMVQQAIAQRSQHQQLHDLRPSPNTNQTPPAPQYSSLQAQGGVPVQGYPQQNVPPGYQPDFGQPLPYARQQQQQAYFQDGYSTEGPYRAHSPGAQQAYGQNRYSYQPNMQRTPSPNWRGHRPNDSHDSYFRQGGQGGYR